MRILLPSLLILAACTPTTRDLERQADAEAGARAELDRELAGLVPIRSSGCANQRDLRDVQFYGDTLVYRTGSNVKYVTRTSGGCGRTGADPILVTVTPQTQLCRGDIATTVDRTSQVQVGSCSFGEFIRYERPPR